MWLNINTELDLLLYNGVITVSGDGCWHHISFFFTD
jgi:hypothetical protein